MREDKVYYDTCELAYNMYMYSHNPDGKTTEVIASYEIVSDMVKDLLQFEDTTAFSIHLENPEMDAYEDEYLLTIDDENSTLVFVHNDVNSKAILGIDEKVIQPFEFQWEQE